MKRNLLPLLTGLFLCIQSLYAQLTDTDFTNLFNSWNDALQTGKPEVVAALYTEDGVLLPTVSNNVKSGRDAIRQYFQNFLEYKPKGKIISRFTKVFDDDTAMDSGIYEFEITKDGNIENVLARYTFIYEKVGDKWMIAAHHSSVMPNATEATVMQQETVDEWSVNNNKNLSQTSSVSTPAS